MLSAGAAALGVLERLPATRLLAQPAAETLYPFVARNRDRLGRVVPDGSGAAALSLVTRCSKRTRC